MERIKKPVETSSPHTPMHILNQLSLMKFFIIVFISFSSKIKNIIVALYFTIEFKQANLRLLSFLGGCHAELVEKPPC
jgi:hypothetical protein